MAESLRRTDRCAWRRSTPRVATGTSRTPGRQAEIVEVRSELAPLNGLTDAIVDLTATGGRWRRTTVEEREEAEVSRRG